MHCFVKKPSRSAVTFLVAATLLNFVKCALVIPAACTAGYYFKGGTTCTICNPGKRAFITILFRPVLPGPNGLLSLLL